MSVAIRRILTVLSQGFGNSLDGGSMTGFFVHGDEGALQENAAGGNVEALGLVGDEAFDDGVDVTAQNAFVGPCETSVAQIGSAAREDLFVGGLHVSVRADNSADLAIDHSSEGDFFGGGFGVHVHEDDGRGFAQAIDFALDDPKGILDGWHEGAALNIDNRDAETILALEKGAALAGGVGGIIDRTQETGFVLHELVNFLLIPDMVAAGDDVGAGGEDFGGGVLRDAGAARGIFAIGYAEINAMFGAQPRKKFAHGATARFSNDVSYKKNIQRGDSSEGEGRGQESE
jgi:hypothetical protein